MSDVKQPQTHPEFQSNNSGLELDIIQASSQRKRYLESIQEEAEDPITR